MKKPKNLSGKLWHLYVAILICSFVFVDLGFAKDSREEKGYTYNLEELSRKADKNIEKVNKKLEKRKAEERNRERELEARRYFKEGDRLSEEGKDEKAKEAWQKALEITKNPEMKGCVEDSKKRARAEKKKVELEKELAFKKEKALEKAKEKAEGKRQRQLKAEQKEKKRSEERLEKKRLQEEALAKKKMELVRKEDQKRFKAEKKKKAKELALTVKKKSQDIIMEASIKLENLTYKSKKECLDILGKNPGEKEVHDNLVNLYVLEGELLDRAKELYKNKNYKEAIQEYNKVLLIDPENKKAKTEIKRARSRMK